VFGTLMRRGAKLPDPPNLPPAVAERWASAWGDEVVAAAARLIATPPPLDLAGEPPAEVEGTSLMPGHLRLARGTAVAGITGFGEGRWWVQDISASIPARLLGPGAGRTALDLCAAPGGKTMQLAAAGFAVTAVDSSEARLVRLRENLGRTGLSAEVVAGDVMTWAPKAPVDAVLLDAPCTATGIYRRHPEVLHRVRPRAIAELALGQARMLARAAEWVKPGGILVYSVCSLEPEEGERIADAFLASRPDYALAPISADELPEGLAGGDSLRILPGAFEAQGGADSFFIARFRRAG
jgi:16S rRNA (cytosine967-C5)-methyltransferase